MFTRLFRGARRRKIVGWASIVLVSVLVGASLTAYAKYRSVWDSIHHFTITGLHNRPPRYSTSAMNILVFGVDSRSDLTLHQQARLHVGRNAGEVNTDTIMVVHISPGHRAMTVMSIPRDTEVPIYGCPGGHGWSGLQKNLSTRVLVNSVYASGGPSCLIETVEQLTGIHIDHVVELDFLGFVKVINDLGGVNICLPFAVHDQYSGLKLSKGEHHINGVQALEFWRTRYSIGTGTDLQRIQRDQYFVAQLLHAILHSGLLSNPAKLLSVVTDTAKSLTTDSGMTQSVMLHIAESMRGINAAHVQFVTAPNQTYPPDPSHVELQQPQADRLFHAIAHDTKLPHKSKAKSSKKASPKTATQSTPPAKVKVEVLNGSGVAGVAGTAAAALTSRGFDVVGTPADAIGANGAPDFSYTQSVIEYSSASELPAVNTLKKQLTHVTVQQGATAVPGTIELILGSTFNALASPSPATTSSPKSVSKIAKKDGGISGNVACKGDQAAFAGPNSP